MIASRDQRLFAFSVDLDEIEEYFAIHGLGETPSGLRHLVYDVALPRLLEFANSESLPVTLFVIGRDLKRDENRRNLRRFVERGDELGNHTLEHRYDFSRLSPEDRMQEIAGAQDAIASVAGARPSGFRAPGYLVCDALFRDLEELGYSYDSSVFSSPLYYCAKAAVIGGQRVFGRSSKSVVDWPQGLLAPTRPYRVGERYYRRGSGLREIPITLTKHLRVPFFGTAICLAQRFGTAGVDWLARGVRDAEALNIELHGIDFLDVGDGLAPLRSVQPGLAMAWREKVRAYTHLVRLLRGWRYRASTLREMAQRVLP